VTARRTIASIAWGGPLPLIASSLVVIGVPSVAAQSTPSPAHTRSVYVSALDGNGAVVADLTPADVSIKEDDRAQPVLRLVSATARMSIAVLVDDSGIGLDDFRLGVARLMNPLLGQAEFSLVGLAGQNRTLMEFTDQNAALVGAVRGLRARTGQSEQHLVEAVLDALKVVEKREAARPVIVVLTNQARESGNSAVQSVMDRLARTGAVLQVVEVLQPAAQTRDLGQTSSASAFSRDNNAAEPDRARSQVLGNGPAATGGRRHELVGLAGVPAAMASIAQELAGQYEIVFGSSAELDVVSKISISTTRPGVKLHAPTRAANRVAR
jgi:VWFA-related protein